MALLGMAMGSVSCSDDDVNEVAEQQEATYVTLTINTGGTVASRALNFEDEEASDLENYINLNDVRLYFFPDDAKAVNWKSDGTSNGTWSGASWWGTAATLLDVTPTTIIRNADGKSYTLECVFTPEKGGNTLKEMLDAKNGFRVAVMANWAQEKKVYTIDWSSIFATEITYYNYPDVYNTSATQFELSKETPIPMFGLKRVTDVTMQKGKNTDLGRIDMIRAMAKVELKTEKLTLSNVQLSKYTFKGCLAPFAMWTETDFTPEHDGFYISIPYEHNSTGYPGDDTFFASNLAFNEVEKGKDYVIYIPEFRQVGESLDTKNTRSKDTSITFNVEGFNETQTIEFAEYDDHDIEKKVQGTEFNLLRNHHYLYEVEKADKLTLKYKVIPWNEEIAGDITFN
jgi:hypothetical protein